MSANDLSDDGGPFWKLQLREFKKLVSPVEVRMMET